MKTGYYFWQNLNAGESNCTQSEGWRRIWSLSIPNKVKILVWRFCRNVIPVRNRLRGKGIHVPVTCPMCNRDIEHLLHLFFDCPFANGCWQSVNIRYAMGEVHFAPDWLLQILTSAKHDEVVAVCLVLWGIWCWRNKRVWQNQFINPSIAMENTFQMYKDWKVAHKSSAHKRIVPSSGASNLKKWQPPSLGALKLNVMHLSFQDKLPSQLVWCFETTKEFFVEGKCLSLPRLATVLEAESIGVREALSWLMEDANRNVTVKTDSLLVVRALKGGTVNLLEVGSVLEHCRLLLRDLPQVTLGHVRKQANRVAHSLARIPVR